MAYIHSHSRGLGLDLDELINKGGPAVAAVAKVVQDPALPEVTCHVLRLNKITEGKDPGPPCTRRRYMLTEKKQGIGLTLAVTPLRVAVWARANPLLAAGAGLAVAGLLVGAGYSMGRRQR